MKLLCTCGHRFINIRTGVQVVEYDDGGPCRIWGADLMKCFGGHMMLRTADQATERWHAGFDEELELVTQGEKDDAWFEFDRHVYDYACKRYPTEHTEEK